MCTDSDINLDSSHFQQQSYNGYAPQAQAPIAKPVAASVWSEHKTDDGNTYWYNASTGVSQVRPSLKYPFVLPVVLNTAYDRMPVCQ